MAAPVSTSILSEVSLMCQFHNEWGWAFVYHVIERARLSLELFTLNAVSLLHRIVRLPGADCRMPSPVCFSFWQQTLATSPRFATVTNCISKLTLSCVMLAAAAVEILDWASNRRCLMCNSLHCSVRAQLTLKFGRFFPLVPHFFRFQSPSHRSSRVQTAIVAAVPCCVDHIPFRLAICSSS